MKRWLLTILLFLLLGTVVNVLVALGCTAYWTSDGAFLAIRGVRGFGYRVRRDEFHVDVWNDVSAHNLGEGATIRRQIGLLQSQTSASRHHVDTGVPMLSLSRPLSAYEAYGSFFVLQPPNEPKTMSDSRLPSLRPLWPGFIANTLFYAVLLWLPICGLFVLRCQSRKRRGRCLKCGYPAGTSPTCTECGAPLPVRKEHA